MTEPLSALTWTKIIDTPLVYVTPITGRQHKIRALIDPCSHIFISSDASTLGRTSVTVTLCINSTISEKINTLIARGATTCRGIVTILNSKSSHLEGLVLADDVTTGSGSADILLWADVYSFVAPEGFGSSETRATVSGQHIILVSPPLQNLKRSTCTIIWWSCNETGDKQLLDRGTWQSEPFLKIEEIRKNQSIMRISFRGKHLC